VLNCWWLRKLAGKKTFNPCMFKDLNTRFLRPRPTSTVRRTVHTISVSKTEVFQNALQTGGIWKRLLGKIAFGFSCLSFPETQIQNDQRLLPLHVSPALWGKKTYDAFSEWTPVFELLRAAWTALLELLWFGGRGSTWSWFSSCNCYSYYLMKGSTKFMGDKLFSSLTTIGVRDEQWRKSAR